MVVEERAEVGHLVGQERFFFGAQFGLVGVDEFLEGGRAAEDVAVESWTRQIVEETVKIRRKMLEISENVTQ